MALGNYTELKEAVADWLARSDLDDRIPDFIRMAEAMFNREIRHRSMQARSETTLTAGDSYVGLPANFREMITVTVESDPRRVLDPINQLDFDRRYGNAQGLPRGYYIAGDEIRIGPPSDSDYTLEILYYQNIPPLGGTQTNNWLLTDWPDVYLYGALIHTAPFIKEDSRLSTWFGAYREAANKLEEDSKHGLFGSGQTMRINMKVT